MPVIAGGLLAITRPSLILWKALVARSMMANEVRSLPGRSSQFFRRTNRRATFWPLPPGPAPMVENTDSTLSFSAVM